MRHSLRRFLSLIAVAGVFGVLSSRPQHALAVDPHTPSEEQLRRRLGEAPADPRDYQSGSVESFRGTLSRALAWLQAALARVQVTPARFLLGLGLLGVLYTYGKNTRKAHWLVLSVFAYLLAAFGGAAMFFGWRYLN